jgi:HSP20 family molecular chaperone IbpA
MFRRSNRSIRAENKEILMNALSPFRSLLPFTRAPWWEDVENAWRRGLGFEEETPAMWAPRVDVLDKPESYLVKVEVPGMKADEIHIDCTGEMLTLNGARKQEEKREGEHYRVVERSYGAFQRTLTFPTAVDPEHVEAELKDGVLNLKIMKAKGARAAKIKVREIK